MLQIEMPVFGFSVWTNRGITNCSLRLEWAFCFGVKNIFWLCKLKRSWNKISSENYIHAMTALPMVQIRAGWIPPKTCCSRLRGQERALYPSFFSEDTGVHHCLTGKKPKTKATKLRKKPRPPEKHWYKPLNSASGTIVIFWEIKKDNFLLCYKLLQLKCSRWHAAGSIQLFPFADRFFCCEEVASCFADKFKISFEPAVLWGSRGVSPEGKWKVSDELHPVIQSNCICLGLPACSSDVSLSSPRTGRSEIVHYDGKLFSEKYCWRKGHVTNFRWTLSQLSWEILFPVCVHKSHIP